MDILAPVIIIGAGRSGTTLLGRLLDRHPDLSIKGESSFLTNRIWLEAWIDRFWLNWQHYNDAGPASACESMPMIANDELTAARTRTGIVVAEFMASLLDVDRERRFWGFKEIWNGAAGHDHDWAHYDCIFPRAWWVHLLRNPFAFARSCARWSCQPMTLDFLRGQLEVWARMITYQRERQRTVRYVELRYEALKDDPKATLTPLFEALGIGWDDACLDAMASHVVSSSTDVPTGGERQLTAEEIANLLSGIEGLHTALDLSGYALPPNVTVDLLPTEPVERPRFCNLREPFGETMPATMPRWALEARIRELEEELRIAGKANQRRQQAETEGSQARSWWRLVR